MQFENYIDNSGVLYYLFKFLNCPLKPAVSQETEILTLLLIKQYYFIIPQNYNCFN